MILLRNARLSELASIKRMLSLLRVFVADDCCPTLTSREEQLANDLPFSEKFSVLPESAGEWG